MQISKPTNGEDITDKFHILDKASHRRKTGEDKDWELYLSPIFVKAEQPDTLLGEPEELTTKISSLAGTAESRIRQAAVFPLFMPITNWLLL